MRALLTVLALLVFVSPVSAQVGLKVVIHGEIVDRDEEKVMVWGTAVPRESGADPNALGANFNPVSIAVLDGKPTMPGTFVGEACYLTKTVGTNAFGAMVPVWVYAPCSYVQGKPLPGDSKLQWKKP